MVIKQHAVSYNSFVHAVIDLCTLTACLISLLGQACKEGRVGEGGRGGGQMYSSSCRLSQGLDHGNMPSRICSSPGYVRNVMAAWQAQHGLRVQFQ